jgi:8-oxo-dGTP pyrophosphatase MutT (NUDIX family)
VIAELRQAVAALELPDARGQASRERFLIELDRLAEPLSEAAAPTHVTSSAVVVGPRGVLLHRHKRLGIWMQPGGHIETGESPPDAAVREVLEETGIPASHGSDGPLLLHVDVHPAPRGHTHLDLRYLLAAGDIDPAPGAGESPDVAWFEHATALAVADPGLVGALHLLR